MYSGAPGVVCNHYAGDCESEGVPGMTGILHRYIQGCYYVINPTLLELYRAIIIAQKLKTFVVIAFCVYFGDECLHA
jgi:hypothetical protein